MSIEAFFSEYKPGPEIVDHLLAYTAVKESSGHPISLVAALADKYLQHGRAGLIACYSQNVHRSRAENFQDPNTRKIIIMNNLAVIVGLTIPMIEATVATEILDPAFLVSRYTSQGSMRMAGIGEFKSPGFTRRNVNYETEWKPMVEALRQDSSYGLFFETRGFRNNLPRDLQNAIIAKFTTPEQWSDYMISFLTSHRAIVGSFPVPDFKVNQI